MSDRGPLEHLHLIAGVGALFIGGFGLFTFSELRYIGNLEFIGLVGSGCMVVALLLFAWAAYKRIPMPAFLGVVAVALLASIWIFGSHYLDAKELMQRNIRRTAVARLCEGQGTGVAASRPPAADARVRYLRKRESLGNLYMDPEWRREWPVEEVPEFVVCIDEAHDVIERAPYRGDDGHVTTFERTRPYVTLRVLRVANAEEVFTTRVEGGMPDPFPSSFGYGTTARTHGTPVTFEQIRQALAGVIPGEGGEGQ